MPNIFDRRLKILHEIFDDIQDPKTLDLDQYKALNVSLGIKRTVVEYDEYERDIRRSMNFGHTFGHAVEKFLRYPMD